MKSEDKLNVYGLLVGEIMSDERLCLSTIAFFDDESITINKKYLIEFCKLAIYQAGILGCTVSEIKNKIHEISGLEYSEDEIISILKNGMEFICDNNRYSLTSEANKEIQQREKSFPLRKYIDLFCDLRKIEFKDVDRNQLCELVTKFIYSKFRQSVEQISRVLQNSIGIGTFDFEQYYTDEEIEFINKFLSWDNDEKNKIIYSLVVKSYDFSVVNCPDDVELDLSDYNFYLDANIIMRMLGINNEYRQKAVSHFLNKCKEIGIVLHVTSFTRAEIKESIKCQIEGIDRELDRFNYIPSPEAIKFSKSDSFTIEIYGKYYEYIKRNKRASLERFSRYLNNQLEKCISEFVYDDEMSYEVQDSSEFYKYYDSLCRIKDEKVVKTDVNNILHVLKKRESGNENHFIISADGKLIEWCKNIFLGKTSLVEFPSVWLSIILKYSGRATGEDYASFCRFIKLPIHHTNTDIKKKIEISNIVIGKDISDKMKDRMFEDLDSNYTSYLKLRDSSLIVDEAFSSVMKKHDEEIQQDLIESFEKEKEKINDKNRIKVKALVNQIKIEKENSRKAETHSVINKVLEEVDDKVKNKIQFKRKIKNKQNMILLIIMVAIVVLSGVTILFFYIITGKCSALFNLIAVLADVFIFPFAKVLLNALGDIDDEMEQRLRIKYEKKLRKKYKNLLRDDTN